MIDELKTSRRTFLKALGAFGAVIALPPVTPNATHGLVIPSAQVVDEDLIDAPITEEMPFGWVTLNGDKIKATRIDVEYQNDGYDLDINRSDVHMTYNPGQTRATIVFDCDMSANNEHRIINELLLKAEKVEFKVSVPGWNKLLVGKAYIVGADMTAGWDSINIKRPSYSGKSHVWSQHITTRMVTSGAVCVMGVI